MGRLETPPTRPLRPSNRTPEKVLPSRGSPAPGKPARPEELLRQENALLGRALEELQARHDELVQSLGSQPPPKTGPTAERCTYWKQRCLEAGLKLVELEQLCAAQRT